MQDETFEKLGQFYLGKQYDMDRRERTDQHLLYDSRDLCTHAVVVGMTGSGKTGLCIDLLEEAAMDNIPAVVIDPKGDISNLLLTFPGLSAEEFLPWIDEGQANRKGLSNEEFAKEEAEKWKNGLAGWGQDGDRVIFQPPIRDRTPALRESLLPHRPVARSLPINVHSHR